MSPVSSEVRSGGSSVPFPGERRTCGSLGQVLVSASCGSDGARLVRLLRKLDYQPLLVRPAAPTSGALPDSGESAQTPSSAMLVCHRQSPGAPIPLLPEHTGGNRLIVLSDCRSESAVVQTLEAGAHHFFSIDEPESLLLVRLKAALRQHFHSQLQHLVVDPFVFDLQKRVVMYEGNPIDLNPKEYEFAHYVFFHRARVVTNDELMTSVWSLPSSMDTRRIDTAACRVRKKMLNATGSGWRLRRLRNVGYELSACPVNSA